MEILPLYECGSLPKFLQQCRAASLPDGSRRPPAAPASPAAGNQAPTTLAAPWLKVVALSLEESSVPLTELLQPQTGDGQLSATLNEGGAPHYLIVMGMGAIPVCIVFPQCYHSSPFVHWKHGHSNAFAPLPLCRQRKRRRAAQRARALRPVDLYRQPTRHSRR
jgi:hypothetical protein